MSVSTEAAPAGVAVPRQRDRSGSEEPSAFHVALAEVAPAMICVSDAAGVVRWVSRSVTEQLGWEPADLLGRRNLRLVHADDVERVAAGLESVHSAAGARDAIAFRFRHRDGQWRDVECVGQDLTDDPRVGGVVLHAWDVTGRASSEAALAHRALHDPLTGLANRSLLLDRIGQAIARRRRHPEQSVALLFCDLDDFKRVNDSRGHLAGDRVLVAVADALRRSLRPGDTAGRLGGDEFVVLCEEVGGVTQGVAVAERIAAALATPLTVDGRTVSLTISVGVVLHAAETDPLDLLARADAAMYEAKAAGRGRVVAR